jgi:citrate synthase
LRLVSERSVRDGFGSDPDDDFPTLVLAEERPLHENGGIEHETLTPEEDRAGARRACERALTQHGRAPGFSGGHPLYPHGDPRAIELLRRLDLPARDPAAKAIAFMSQLGAEPTVELALGALARQARLPPDGAFALFALGRSAGWIAHTLEAAAAATLIRPRARYVGPPPTR